jgi:hypothetical protein
MASTGGTYLFVEALSFTSAVKEYFGSDDAYASFQVELAEHPEKGAVIPGAAPLRKLRWGDKRRGMGKRGGLRVIYIHILDLAVLFMLDVYGKDEADDLSNEEKKELRALAKELADELRERHKRGDL